MLPSVLALLAVTGVVLLLIGIFGDATPEPAAGPGPGPTPSATVTVTLPATTAPPSPSASTPPPLVTSPAATTPPPLPTAFPDLATVVLNGTSEPGLAGRVSEYVAALGWSVGPVGNFDAPMETTTVYYPEGYEAAAAALAAALPQPAAVAPVVEGVATDALTVVLGEDAGDWLPVDDAVESSASAGVPST